MTCSVLTVDKHIQPSSYFAVIIQVLQSPDGYVSYVTSAKQDFTWGETQDCQLYIHLQKTFKIQLNISDKSTYLLKGKSLPPYWLCDKDG